MGLGREASLREDAEINTMPEIYLWVPTTLPISIYTPSLMIYLKNFQIYLKKTLLRKPSEEPWFLIFGLKVLELKKYYFDPLQYTPFKRKMALFFQFSNF